MRRLWKRTPCRTVDGDPYEGITVECTRRKGHRGDHREVVRWPQYVPPPPRDPNEPSLGGLHFKPEAWSKLLMAQLSATLVQPQSGDTIRIVNPDAEEG